MGLWYPEHKLMAHLCNFIREHILLPSKLGIEGWDLATGGDLGRGQGDRALFIPQVSR